MGVKKKKLNSLFQRWKRNKKIQIETKRKNSNKIMKSFYILYYKFKIDIGKYNLKNILLKKKEGKFVDQSLNVNKIYY